MEITWQDWREEFSANARTRLLPITLMPIALTSEGARKIDSHWRFVVASWKEVIEHERFWRGDFGDSDATSKND